MRSIGIDPGCSDGGLRMNKATALPARASTPPAPSAAAESQELTLARAMLQPAMSAALAISPFAGDLPHEKCLQASMESVKAGDLSHVEEMLVGQAVALQAMFSELARRAGENMGNRAEAAETLLRMALKCQAQSRATIDSLVNLKFPRTTVIAKHANVNGSGQMQVNNGAPSNVAQRSLHVPAHVEEVGSAEIKLLEEDHGQPSGRLDAGTTAAPARGDSPMEAVGAIHRPQNSRRKGRGGA